MINYISAQTTKTRILYLCNTINQFFIISKIKQIIISYRNILIACPFKSPLQVNIRSVKNYKYKLKINHYSMNKT